MQRGEYVDGGEYGVWMEGGGSRIMESGMSVEVDLEDVNVDIGGGKDDS